MDSSHETPTEKALRNPTISWPTIGLFLTGASIWITSVLIGEHNLVPRILCSLINTVVSFAMFTVMHDAAHRAIASPKYQWINETLGRIAAFWMNPFAAFVGFRRIHLLHHAYTNNEKLDPDYLSSHSESFWVPLACACQMPYYYIYYITKCIKKNKFGEPLEMVVQVGIMIWFYVDMYYNKNDFFWKMATYHAIPGAVAVVMLALLFDYIPHRVYKNEGTGELVFTTTPQKDHYHTTSFIKMINLPQMFASMVLLYQDYHVIHHLHPKIPFYRYKLMWEAKKDELLNKREIHVQKF
jgi:fatty acid desaturase